LGEEQQRELKQCLNILLAPESSSLSKGHALLSIIDHRLMPSWPDVVEANRSVFHLSQSEVRKLVRLAREDRAQNGGNPPLTGGEICEAKDQHSQPDGSGVPVADLDARHHGDSTSKQPEASSPEEDAGVESSVAPAPPAAPETKRPRKRKLQATETVAPKEEERVEILTQPPVSPAQSVTLEPAPSSDEAVQTSDEEATAALTAPALAEVSIGKPDGLLPVWPTDLTEDDWASRINEGMGEGIKRFINVGSDLLAAKSALGHGRWMKMFESGRIRMSLRMAEMFMRVAALSTLLNSQHLANLPPSLTALAALAGGPVEFIEAGIKSGRIHPGLTAKEAKNLIRAACSNPIVKRAGKVSASDTVCPPPGTETADPSELPAEAVMPGAGDASDNPPPALTPPAAAPSQPEPSHDEALVLSGPPEFDLEIEWPPIEAALETLYRHCPPTMWPDLWNKLNGFFAAHPEFILDEAG